MADAFLGEKLVMLYTVSFANVGDEVVCPNMGEGEEGENSGDEEMKRNVLNDPYWKVVMRDDNDTWDTIDEPIVGTSTRGGETSTFGDDWHDFIEFDEEVVSENDGDSGDEEGAHGEAAQLETTHVGGSSGLATSAAQLLDDDEEDEVSSKLARSDILITPPKSNEEYEAISGAEYVTRTSQFQDVDMEDPHLEMGMSFDSAGQFRKVVREYNLFRGKDVEFTKNDGNRVIGVCRNRAMGCPWRVYGASVPGEMTFLLKSLNPNHRCTRCYKSSIVNSRWIADRMVHKFKTQPNYPLAALCEDVKMRWNVEVSFRQLYRAKEKAKEQIEGKNKEQYKQLWDYCATVRQTNRGRTMLMKVERPTLDVPPTFQRLYMSLAACKDGFRQACRPVIGVDDCFLKGRYRGQLLAVVGRDPNDNIYPIAMAVVEAETKDS
jgi:hypothetical protein